MLLQDFTQGHLLGESQWCELSLVWICCIVLERELEHIAAEHAHGNGLTLAAIVPAQLLLGLDDVLKPFVGDSLLAFGHEADLIRTVIFDRWLHMHFPAAIVLYISLSGEEWILRNLATKVQL